MKRIKIDDFAGIEELLEDMGLQYSPAGYYLIDIDDNDDEGIISNLNFGKIKYRQEYIVEDKDPGVPLLRVHISPQLRRGRRVLEDRFMLEGFKFNGFSWVHKRYLHYDADCVDYELESDGCEDEGELGISQGLKELKVNIVKQTHRIRVTKRTEYEVEVEVY